MDVMSDILDAAHLRTAVYGRLSLGEPWELRIPARNYLSFYVVARGGGWLEIAGDDGEAANLPLSAGDLLLLPRGAAHRLADFMPSRATPIELDYMACPRPWFGESTHFGGAGPVTVLVTGQFTLGSRVSRNPLLQTLPGWIHIPADRVVANPQLSSLVPLILSESARPGPGAAIVLARLADLLLIHALRHWITTADPGQCGLHAVADPAIGETLRLMHARPAEGWTVEGLASAAALSRSAFSERFTRLVGESPLKYLTRWRMMQAARLLRSGHHSIPAVAAQVGYSNPAAFAKAFARFQGVGPGAFRRAHGEAQDEEQAQDGKQAQGGTHAQGGTPVRGGTQAQGGTQVHNEMQVQDAMQGEGAGGEHALEGAPR